MKVKCINNEDWEKVLVVGKIYDVSEVSYDSYKIEEFEINCFDKNRFEIVEQDKIVLLLEDKFKLEIVNTLYKVHIFYDYIKIDKNISINGFWHEEFYIRFGKKYNTTLEQIKPVFDAMGIELRYPEKKYKLKADTIYTQEQMEKLAELGLDFEEIK